MSANNLTTFLATFETRNFSFSAIGATKAHAKRALIAGLRKHARQYGIPLDWYVEDENEITVTAMRLGAAYRDNGEIL